MIQYQLPTGKTIYISFEEFIDMTDQKEQEYIANDIGYHVHDPFYMSSIHEREKKDKVIIDFINIEVIELDGLIEPLDLDDDELTE
jgi:hypothetical protein